MPDENEIRFLTLKKFLELHPFLAESTVRRWIRNGKLPHRQPGGPKTLIFLPKDALERIENLGEQAGTETTSHHDSQSTCDSKMKAVRKPDWMRGS